MDGPDDESEIAARGAHAYGARQLVRLRDPIDEYLRRRNPDHAGESVHDQEQFGLPQTHAVAEEHEAPADRHAHEQQHADLNQTTGVESVGQRPRVAGEEQKGNPMRDDGESAERGGVKFLIYHPITDDMLDVVGHHCRGRADEVNPEVRIREGRERAVRRAGRPRNAGLDVQK